MQILVKFSLKKVREEAARFSLYHAETIATDTLTATSTSTDPSAVADRTAERFHTFAINIEDTPLIDTLLSLAWLRLQTTAGSRVVSASSTPTSAQLSLRVPETTDTTYLCARLCATGELLMISIVVYEWLRLRGVVSVDGDVADAASELARRISLLSEEFASALSSGIIASPRRFSSF